MDANQKQLIKDAITNLEEAQTKVQDYMGDIKRDIEKEKENLSGLAEDLESAFDEMDEKEQESKKGQDLSSEQDNVNSVVGTLETLESSAETAHEMFQDAIDELKALLT
jgi:predicted  nucleic acid-binding Zn-ribbon protein